MRRRGCGRLLALVLAAAAGASCGDAEFDLLPAEVRAGDGGAAGSSGQESGAAGASEPGGDGGSEPQAAGSAGACSGPDCERDCAPWDALCVFCDDEDDCSEPTPFCEEDFNRCVECRGDLDCDPGDSCDPLSGSCAPSCTLASECGDERPLCDQARGICVECIEDAHCRTDRSSPFCVIGKCVECFTSQHCPNYRPYCEQFVCRECTENWQCDSGERCDDGFCERNF